MAASSSLFSGGSSPAELWSRVGSAVGPVGEHTALTDKVRTRAYAITDNDVAGLDADELYEAVLPVAFEEADARLRAALEAIDAG